MRSQGLKGAEPETEGVRFFTGRAMGDLLVGVLNRGASFRFQAKGHSMSPFIREGDVLVISPIRRQHLRKGRVVAFLHPQGNRLIIHRIIGQNPASCLLKGDNNLEADGEIPRENIVGYVSRIERKDRKIVFGAGPEGSVISVLSSRGLLPPLLRIIRPVIRLCRTLKGASS